MAPLSIQKFLSFGGYWFHLLGYPGIRSPTLCLSICNRMAPPMQHQLYPLLEVEYDCPHRAHFLTDTDAEVPLPPLKAPHRRWLHSHCVAYKSEETEAFEGSLHS